VIFSPHHVGSAVSLVGDRDAALTSIRGRLTVVLAVFSVLFSIAALRVVDVMVVRPALKGEDVGDINVAYREDIENNAGYVLGRGQVFDRNGVLMATSIETASVFADPRLIENSKAAAQGLAKIFPDLSYGDVLRKLQSDQRFVWIKRNVTPEEQYQVLTLGQPGLEFEREDRRLYPQEDLAPHILGYTNVDNRGLSGVERSFDSLLAQGDDLSLTIDSRLQHILRREIGMAMREFTAKAGMGAIMDVQTGEVLAAVSLPDFTPHHVSDAGASAKFNRFSLGVYELGSVFKVFSTAALLDHFNLPMETTFDAREPIKTGRHTISDYHPEDRELTIPEAFMHSSNIVSALMAQQIGTKRLKNFYSDLGLLSPLSFELLEVGKPLVPDPWRETSTMTAAYGHGLATTPLQVLSAFASVVNGGTYVQPRLIQNDENKPQKAGLRVMSEETSQEMNALLRLVVTQGTGKNADVPGFYIGGKTGTAEKIGKRGYDRKRLISSFVGAFPMDRPRYAVLVSVDEPKGNKKSYGYATAGWVAAPAVARIVRSMASVLGLSGRDAASVEDIDRPLYRHVAGIEKKDKSLVSY
jgi:cell division protein FtsI (penicillin-binding protein 3)